MTAGQGPSTHEPDTRERKWRRRCGKAVSACYAARDRRPGAIRAARRHIPPAFFLAALTILIVALARPQTVVSLPRLEGTIILAFDVSGSMAADDLKPSRMEAAKTAALPGDLA